MRIENHLSRERFMQYAAFQRKQLSSAVDALEPEWEHASVVREILNETQEEVNRQMYGEICEFSAGFSI